MAKPWTRTLALCLSLPLLAAAADRSDPGPPARGPESAVLDRFVGTWRGELEITAADGSKTSQTWKNAFAWSLNGRFLKDEGGDIGGSASFLGMWTYDPALKRFRSWYFQGPDGMVANLDYAWDGKSRELSGKADLGGGMTVETVDKFIDGNHYEWNMVIKDKEGRMIRKIAARQTRI